MKLKTRRVMVLIHPKRKAKSQTEEGTVSCRWWKGFVFSLCQEKWLQEVLP